MDSSKIIDKINDQAKKHYASAIDECVEDSKNVNWLLGLAGAALLFSFNKFDGIDLSKTPFVLIMVQAFTFVAIIVTGFIYRTTIKNFKRDTAKVMRMLDFLRFEFDLVPDEIVSDLENGKFDKVYDDYVQGVYFIDDGADQFDLAIESKERNFKLYKRLTILAIALMCVQFGCFFLNVLKF